jgi:hypothetical protein
MSDVAKLDFAWATFVLAAVLFIAGGFIALAGLSLVGAIVAFGEANRLDPPRWLRKRRGIRR